MVPVKGVGGCCEQPFPQCFVSAEDAGAPADDVQEDVERAQPAGLCSAAGGEFFLSLF